MVNTRVQKDTGSIVGVVRDPSGAVVAGAKVKVTEVDQGTSFDTSTNDSGGYGAAALRIGRYNVTVEKRGLKREVVGPIVLDVQARPAVKCDSASRPGGGNRRGHIQFAVKFLF